MTFTAFFSGTRASGVMPAVVRAHRSARARSMALAAGGTGSASTGMQSDRRAVVSRAAARSRRWP
ncbi:hypothetical protein SHIRM173S_07426 [Streptomyces hirsutus]